MESRYTRSITVLPSRVDSGGRLSVADTFDLFMDVATQAAGEMGVGYEMLKRRGLIWITVKTRIRFVNRPAIMQTARVTTWPEAPGEKRCNRHYLLEGEGGALVAGKTEWAIVSALTGRPQPMDKVLPQGFDYPGEAAIADPFPMIDEDFPDPPYAEHRVVATDIDMARHMNNVAYVRAIVDSFSLKEWKKLDVGEMTVIFRASAHEGDTLVLQKRRGPEGLDIRASLPDGQTIVLARLN